MQIFMGEMKNEYKTYVLKGRNYVKGIGID